MGKDDELSVWENNPFIDGLFEYMASPEGQLADEVRDVTWQLLEKMDAALVDKTDNTVSFHLPVADERRIQTLSTQPSRWLGGQNSR